MGSTTWRLADWATNQVEQALKDVQMVQMVVMNPH